MLKLLFIVGVGSFAGGISRYLVQSAATRFISHDFPYATFAVNIIGSFIIGVIFASIEKGNNMTEEMRLLLTTGFCGGLTTFSTFSIELFSMFKIGDYFSAFGYVLASVILSTLAVALAFFLVKSI